MAYQLTFFCKATGEESAAGAMDRVLDALLEDGPLFGEHLGSPADATGPEADAVHAFRLATGSAEGGPPAADLLRFEVHVGMRHIAEDAINVDPDDDHGVWGSDLMASVTLTGDDPDWPLVDRIWTILADLWSPVPWDELSGFEIGAGPLARVGMSADADDC